MKKYIFSLLFLSIFGSACSKLSGGSPKRDGGDRCHKTVACADGSLHCKEEISCRPPNAFCDGSSECAEEVCAKIKSFTFQMVTGDSPKRKILENNSELICVPKNQQKPKCSDIDLEEEKAKLGVQDGPSLFSCTFEHQP